MNSQAQVVAVRGEVATRAQEGDEQVCRAAVIQVRGLRKSYDGVDAVAGIDLEVRAGEVFAFLGPNGAGETHDWRVSADAEIQAADFPGHR